MAMRVLGRFWSGRWCCMTHPDEVLSRHQHAAEWLGTEVVQVAAWRHILASARPRRCNANRLGARQDWRRWGMWGWAERPMGISIETVCSGEISFDEFMEACQRPRRDGFRLGQRRCRGSSWAVWCSSTRKCVFTSRCQEPIGRAVHVHSKHEHPAGAPSAAAGCCPAGARCSSSQTIRNRSVPHLEKKSHLLLTPTCTHGARLFLHCVLQTV